MFLRTMPTGPVKVFNFGPNPNFQFYGAVRMNFIISTMDAETIELSVEELEERIAPKKKGIIGGPVY